MEELLVRFELAKERLADIRNENCAPLTNPAS